MQQTRKKARLVETAVLVSILLVIQFYAVMMTTTRAAYYGIQFGTEAQVSSGAANDVWKVDKLRYNFIAQNQTKPEVDLLGLHINREPDAIMSHSDFEIVSAQSTNKTINCTYHYAFNVPLKDVMNVSYTFRTYQTYSHSAMEFFNWTKGKFQNQSRVMNQSAVLLSNDFYESQQILILFNITNSVDFTFWYNITLTFWYVAKTQVISIQFGSLKTGNASLVDNLRAWIFFDTDQDDEPNYVILWTYQNSTFLYQIDNHSYTLNGAWNGTYGEYWTGMSWVWGGIASQNFSIIDSTKNMLNLTIPDFAVNLTATVHYAVWSQEIGTDYDWWDALPEDPYWQVSVPIPAFQGYLVALSLVLIGVIFLRKIIIKVKRV